MKPQALLINMKGVDPENKKFPNFFIKQDNNTYLCSQRRSWYNSYTQIFSITKLEEDDLLSPANLINFNIVDLDNLI